MPRHSTVAHIHSPRRMPGTVRGMPAPCHLPARPLLGNCLAGGYAARLSGALDLRPLQPPAGHGWITFQTQTAGPRGLYIAPLQSTPPRRTCRLYPAPNDLRHMTGTGALMPRSTHALKLPQHMAWRMQSPSGTCIRYSMRTSPFRSLPGSNRLKYCSDPQHPPQRWFMRLRRR